MAGIYIHIPFCKSKCNYCNFYSIASLKYKNELIEAILREIEIQKDYLQNEEIKTIYFGGGTPSLLSADEINKISDKIYSLHSITEMPEITLETNPDDINRDKIRELKRSQVNRISLGIQSLADEDLKYLSRRHNGKQSSDAVKLLQDSGYSNLSVDLIYGIPTLTNEALINNIETAISWNVPHISAYSLTVEPKTALEHMIHKGKLAPINDEQSIEHFNILLKLLTKSGYLHYEISNYCKEGFYSKHNTNYWKGEKYLGIGPSAHSFNGNSRQWNVSKIRQYIDKITLGEILVEKEILTEKQKYNEYVLVTLRTMWGCDSQYVLQTFGEEKYEYLLNGAKRFEEQGMVEIKSDIITLTNKGKLFADRITSELFITE